MSEQFLKNCVAWIFDEIIRDLKEIQSDDPHAEVESVADILEVYENWDLDVLVEALKVNCAVKE